MGPLSGFLGLPFWSWGPEATYNGTGPIGLWLSGYCMYLFARDLDMEPSIALFAGLVFQLTPIHIIAIFGHLGMIFIGLLPLTLLCLRRALQTRRSIRWSIATALALLLAAWQSGYQFIFAVVGVVLIWLIEFVRRPLNRRGLFYRSLPVAIAVLVLVVPYLIAMLSFRKIHCSHKRCR